MVFVNRAVRILMGRFSGLVARGPLLIRFIRKAKLLPLLLPLVIYASAQLYLQRSALSVLDAMVTTLPDSVEFRFDQLDTNFGGGVDIQGATLLLPGMSLPVQFQRLHINNSNWRELSSMASDLSLGLLPRVLHVEFTLLETELSRLKTASLLPLAATQMALGCFESASATATPEGDAVAVFSGRFDYRFDPQSEYLNTQLQLSAQQRYRVVINADLDIGAPQLRLDAADMIGLGGADISYLNLGTQSTLLSECGAKSGSGLVEGVYIAKQSARVKQRLSQQGWMVSTELELAYQDYLFLPLQLNLQLSAAKAVNLLQLAQVPASWGQFAVRIGLNTSQADSQGLTWLPTANQWLAAAGTESRVTTSHSAEQNVEQSLAADNSSRVAVAVLQTEALEVQLESELEPQLEPELESRLEDLSITARRSPLTEAQLQQQLQQTILYQPSYKSVGVAELAGLLGAPLRLTTRNGRQMEGVLEQIDFDRLQLRSDSSYGTAILPVRLDIIGTVQAYF